MDANKHTPGPWLVQRTDDRFDSADTDIRIIDGSKYSLTHPQGPITIARINVAAHAPHLDEPAANAALMAAAPELFAALEAALPMIDGYKEHSGTVCTQIRAAIAKAKGGQP